MKQVLKNWIEMLLAVAIGRWGLKATTPGSIITQAADRVHLTSLSLAMFHQTYRPSASELS